MDTTFWDGFEKRANLFASIGKKLRGGGTVKPQAAVTKAAPTQPVATAKMRPQTQQHPRGAVINDRPPRATAARPAKTKPSPTLNYAEMNKSAPKDPMWKVRMRAKEIEKRRLARPGL